MRLPAAIGAIAAWTALVLAVPALAQDTNAEQDKPELNTLQELWDALGACWMPPPRDKGRPGTEITVRFSLSRAGLVIGEPRITYSTPALPDQVKSAYQQSVMAALRRCTPLHLSGGLGGAIAGRPIAARYLDDRDD